MLKLFDIAKEAESVSEKGMRDWLIDQLTLAFDDARKGKLGTVDEHKFEVKAIDNIVQLADDVLSERFEPGASKAFVVLEPKPREIFAAPFRDRVIHHFLVQIVGKYNDNHFIHNSYSCREGKGTLFGVKQAQRMMVSAIEETKAELKKAGLPTELWKTREYCPKIWKGDLRGYFMSIDRKILYQKIHLSLERQFGPFFENQKAFRIYKICEFLWKKIVFDDPISKARRCGNLSYWDPEILPERRSMFAQPPGYGIVIGNYTSQMGSNILLDCLDRYVSMELGYKRYGRYVDDFFVIVLAKEFEKFKKEVPKIGEFLERELALTLHPDKRYSQDVTHGMEFLGTRIYPYALYPSDRLQSKFLQATEKIARGEFNEESLISYLGLMSKMNAADGFIERVFEMYGWRRGYEGVCG